MKLTHKEVLPSQGDGFYRTRWTMVIDGKVIMEFTHEYPAVQTPAVTFRHSLRKTAARLAREKGHQVPLESINIDLPDGAVMPTPPLYKLGKYSVTQVM